MSTNINITKRIGIKEEGAPITSNVSNIDYVGAGVTASAIGENVTVNIPGSIGATAYYLNQTVNQAPYKEFSSAGTTAVEQVIPFTVSAGATLTVVAYQTPVGVPNITAIPQGLWQFFLHFNAITAGQNWVIRPYVYKRDLGGIETLIYTADPVIVTSMGTTTAMYVCDGVFSNTTLLTTDRLVVKIDMENISGVSQTANFRTEGSQHYSVVTTTLNQAGISGSVNSVTGTAPVVSSGGSNPAISMPAANATTDGYLTSTNWNTFNNKQNPITLTTIGTTGPATFIANVLNIPNYSFTSVNIFNSDGTLTTDRVLNGNGKQLLFDSLEQFVINIIPPTSAPFSAIGMEVNVDSSNLVPGGKLVDFIDTVLGTSVLGILKTGQIQINSAYKLPNTDGSLNQVLTTDGAGVVSWATSAAGNIYSTDGTLAGTRTLSGAGFDLIFDALNTFTTTIVPAGGVNGFVVNVDTTLMSGSIGTRIFKVVDINAGAERFGISRNGNAIFNNAFTFPLGDGTPSQVLSTNGGGIVSWTDRLDTTSFYKQFMVNQFCYFLPSDSGVLYDTLRANGTLTSSGTTSALVENPMGVLYTTAVAVGSAVSLFGNTFGGSILGTNFQFELYRKFRINSTNGAQRFFTGISSLYTATAPTNIEPTSQINSIGVCKLQASSTLFLMWNDATGVASSIDTGFSAVSTAFTYLLRIYKTFGVAQIELELTQITNSTGATSVFVQTITSDYNTGAAYYPVAWMGNNTAVSGVVSFKDYGCILTKRNIISA